MCTSIRKYRQEGENLGKQIGREEGMKLGEKIGKQEGMKIGEKIGKQEGMKLGENIGKSKGIKIGMIETLKLLINNQLGYISEEITNLLNKSNEEQLQTLTLSITTIHNEEDIKKILL